MWLAERDGGGTELRRKVKVDVLGRMGTFGLGVMKTKADRLWDEFGVNAAARLVGGDGSAVPAAVAPVPAPVVPAAPAVTQATAPVPVAAALAVPLAVPAGATQVPAPGFWARLFGARQDIRVEVQRGDTRIVVSWPVQAAPECAAWLRSLG